MKITNNANLPESIVRAVSIDEYDYENAGDISASALTESPRQFHLKKRHRDEITEDASNLIWKLIGNIGHKIAERAAQLADARVDVRGAVGNSLVEERLKVKVLGWELTGKMDLLYEHGGYGIDDFKFTSVWAMKDEKPEWTSQLNTYAWLARQHGFEIKRLRIIAVLRDWQNNTAARDPEYPQVGVVVREVPLWSEAKQHLYVIDRIMVHQMAEKLNDDQLPECTDEERWAKPDMWAVKKNGAKRALRLLPTQNEALAMMDELGAGYGMQYRPGNKTTRCDNYCAVNIFCNQYRRLKGEG